MAVPRFKKIVEPCHLGISIKLAEQTGIWNEIYAVGYKTRHVD
jgi:hypothetical protein